MVLAGATLAGHVGVHRGLGYRLVGHLHRFPDLQLAVVLVALGQVADVAMGAMAVALTRDAEQ